MTDEKIISLAREYRQHAKYPFEDMTEAKLAAMDVLKWLSETHCIVEKEKIKALYTKMELDGNHVDSDNDWAVYEAMDGLEKIFGEELFNGTEK